MEKLLHKNGKIVINSNVNLRKINLYYSENQATLNMWNRGFKIRIESVIELGFQ